MANSPFPDTSASLLSALRRQPGNPEAWGRFVETYGPQILQWCRRWGLQDADAQDVTQTILLRFLRRAEKFDYDRSRRFRGWLRALAHSTWYEFVKRRREGNRGLGGDAEGPIGSIEARDAIADFIETEYAREVLRCAMERVRVRVEPRTWEAFRLLNIEMLSGEETATRLGMKLGSAFAASAKVRRLVREELEREEVRREEPPSR
jgi:RNA polymerase sigma factor (sigma-70 family)